MELTKQHFDQQIKSLRAGMATKKDLEEAVEQLAVITHNAIEDVVRRVDVSSRVSALELDMRKIKDAIHIK